MADDFEGYSVGVSGPLMRGFAITPSDAADLPSVTRQIRVTGAAGDIVVTWADGSVTTEPVQANETLDWRIRKVAATGTTATGLRGYV
jgi:hypothetical protein